MSSSALLKAPAQARSRRRVALILETSRRLLAREGVNALTTNSIAAEAAIPVSSIYQYFPNKVAILIAIFEDYLAAVQVTYDELESLNLGEMPWQQGLSNLLEMLFRAEQYEGIELELVTAFYLFPELREIDELHAQTSAQRLAKILRSWGANGSKKELGRVAKYFYHMAASGWTQRLQQPARADELTEFTHRAAVGLLEPLFSDRT